MSILGHEARPDYAARLAQQIFDTPERMKLLDEYEAAGHVRRLAPRTIECFQEDGLAIPRTGDGLRAVLSRTDIAP